MIKHDQKAKPRKRRKQAPARGPQGLPIQSSSQQKAVRPRVEVQPETRPAPASQPGPYRQTERKRVARYKRTPEYRGAVRAAYKTRPTSERSARVRVLEQRILRANATRNRSLSERGPSSIAASVIEQLSPEDWTILHEHASNMERGATLAEGRARSTGFSDAERRRVAAWNTSDAAELQRAVAYAADHGGDPGPYREIMGGEPKQQRMGAGEELLKNPLLGVPKNLVQATVEDPGAVARSSARTAVESVAGIPQGLKMILTDPGAAAKGIAADYSRRYGPLLAGDEEEFRERVKEESGLTPFVLDTGAGVAAGGRVLGGLARRGALGSRALRAATEERPRLRSSGGEAGVREQPLSKNLIVAAGQRQLDTARQRAYVKRAERAGYRVEQGQLRPIPGRRPQRMSGLRPGEGEVLPFHSLRESKALKQFTGRTARDLGNVKSRGRIRLLTARARELGQVQKHIDRLDERESLTLKYAVQFGLDPGRLPAAVRALETHLSEIRSNRAAGDGAIPAVLRETNDEIPVIEEILRDPAAHITPRLREVADELIAVQKRTEALDPDLTPDRAGRRARAPQAALLGLSRADPQEAGRLLVAAESRQQKFAAAVADRQARGVDVTPGLARRLDQSNVALGQAREMVDLARREGDDFDAKVAREAEAAGLREPGYWMSSARPVTNYSDAAIGTGGRAVAGSRRYTGSLHRIGAEEVGPDVFVRGVERNIKRRFSWALVARNMETHAFEWSRGVNGEGLTAGQILRYMDEHAIDGDSVSFIHTRIARRRDPDEAGLERGRFEESDDAVLNEVGAELRDGRREVVDLQNEDVRGQAMNRYLAVPRDVADELQAMARPDGAILRGLEIVLKQKPARIILGTLNIPWLSFQVASNAVLTGLGGGKNPLDIYGAHKWWRGLDEAERDAIEAELGITHGAHFAMDQTRMGSTVNGRFANFYRGYKASRVGRSMHRANPLDAMFAVDEAQNNFFRKVLFYNAAKRDAYRRMGSDWKSIDGIQKKLMEIVGRPPEELGQAIALNGRRFEDHAKKVNDFLGNYLTFSNRERQLLSRNVMFYGYLRFSLRFAFWTLPVEHPIMADLIGNVGRLGADEIKKLFGVEASYWLPTNMLAKAYFGDRKDAERGTLKSVNFGRMNPLLNSVTQVSSPSQANQLVGLVSPIYGAMADQLFEESSFTGRDWRIRGRPALAESERPESYYSNPVDRARIFANQLFGLAFPYRLAEDYGIPGTGIGPLEGPQGDDSLLWDPRPTGYKDEEVVKSIRRSTERERDERGGVLGGLLPFTPRTDPGPQIVEREREREADVQNRGQKKSKKRKQQGFKWSASGGGGSSSSSGGGGWKWGG